MAFISKIANYIENNYDLSKESLTIIFPNKRAALKLRTELTKNEYKDENGKHKNVWLPQILSIQEAMCSWSGLQLLDNIDIIFELIKIINKKITSNDIYGLASQMLKDFDEIDQYAVNAQNLFQNTKDAKEIDLQFLNENYEIDKKHIEFFASLNEYYEALRKELFQNGTGYYGLISRYLYELEQNKLNDAVGRNKIIFAGFNAMTKTEEGIIVKLVKNGNATLLWDLDEYYFNDDKQEAGIFAREFFKRNPNIPLPDQNFLGKNLIEDKKNITIIGASGPVIQTNALQLELHKEFRQRLKTKDNDNTSKELDEVIVLSDESMLIPVLNCLPNTDEFKVQVTMGFPYSKTMLNQFLQHLFVFQKNIRDKEKGVYFWSLVRLLNSELIKTIFTQEDLVDLLKWKNKHIKKSTYYIGIEDYDNIKEYKNPEEKKYCEVYNFMCTISKKWQSTSECINSTKELLTIILNKIKQTDSTRFISNQISIAGRIINKIDKLLCKYDDIIQIADVEMLYKQSASEMTINLKGSQEGLQIMGLLETRNLDFNTIHILSVNEGILPQSKSANSLIPYDLRVYYGLPTYNNKQAVYAYHFYRLLQNAKNINIYHNTLAGSMGEGDSSRFIKQILHEMPSKNHNVNICEKTYKSPNNEHTTKNLEVTKTDEIYGKIVNKLSSVSENGVSGLSPSSISCYLTCPLKFYLQYIEGLKNETPNELIQSNVIGTIIHATLENLYTHFDKNKITLDIYNEVYEKHFNDSHQEALTASKFPNGFPHTGFNHLNSQMMKKMINNFIRYEREFLKSSNTMEIIGLEKELHCSFEIPEHEITVNLVGHVDRIDKVGDKIRILDYKTGQVKKEDISITKNKVQKADLTNFRNIPDKAIQLLIYKYLYKKNDSSIAEENIEPGIFGLKKLSNGVFSLSNTSEYFIGDNLINDCESVLLEIFTEILNKDIPFNQVEDEKKCRNCNFIEICKRNPKSNF